MSLRPHPPGGVEGGNGGGGAHLGHQMSPLSPLEVSWAHLMTPMKHLPPSTTQAKTLKWHHCPHSQFARYNERIVPPGLTQVCGQAQACLWEKDAPVRQSPRHFGL